MVNSPLDVPSFTYGNQGAKTKATCNCCGQEMAAAMTNLHKKLCAKRPQAREKSGGWQSPRLWLWLNPI
jgi:hypothetical protein